MSAGEAAAQRKIINRLRRAHGQLAALIAATERGAPCAEVVTQLAAVSSALDRAGFAIVSSAMRDCLVEPAESGLPDGSTGSRNKNLTPDELEKLFLMLA